VVARITIDEERCGSSIVESNRRCAWQSSQVLD